VRTDSNGLQTPWESTSLERELVLMAAPKAPPPPAAKAVPLATIAAASASRAKSTQPGAAPRFEVGDAWEWRITDQVTNEVRTVKRRIVSITSDEVTFNNGAVRDLSGNTLREKIGDKIRTYAPSTLFFVFPLTPGLTWSGVSVERTGDDMVTDLTAKISAIAEEEIDTPMGRFKTVKVERNADWKNRKNGKTGTSRWTYWYSAQAKSALRFERSNTTSDGRVLIRETQDLIAFSVK
jgi:hypothetical protein